MFQRKKATAKNIVVDFYRFQKREKNRQRKAVTQHSISDITGWKTSRVVGGGVEEEEESGLGLGVCPVVEESVAAEEAGGTKSRQEDFLMSAATMTIAD